MGEQQPQRNQQPMPQQVIVTPGMEAVHHAQAENISNIAKINEANAKAAELQLEIIRANVVKANAEARQAQIMAKRAEYLLISDCLSELKSAMSTHKFVEVNGVGDKPAQLDSAFSEKGQDALEMTYLNLYQKMENFAIEIPKWVNNHERKG
jgi:hypothetical protein